MWGDEVSYCIASRNDNRDSWYISFKYSKELFAEKLQIDSVG